MRAQTLRPDERAKQRDRGRPACRRAAAALAVGAGALCLAGPAAAASAPSASTGPPQKVTYATAILSGTVKPHGQDTSYFFQYGPTKAYGLQTALADAGAGQGTVKVRLPVGGLQPLTRYHFRLIAVNASGASTGGDGFFTTKKIPLSLGILVAPNPVLYGGNALVEGTLSGTGNAGVPVVLQSNPFPYAQGFADVGPAAVTNTVGGFSFPVSGLTVMTHFRVVTIANRPIVSPVALELVAVRVSAHVGHASRAHFARIFGTVTPAVAAAQVGILRIVHGRGVLVAGAKLHPRGESRATFSRVIPVRSGAYRVLVRIVNGGLVSNYSRTLLIG
ncbi:MAG TPA: fibronectin type III domain-containing protein [Solirubrobacteraceae bacterium]|nr:fibronectin type III domain-containing protein [Solirubrobacteraceae bacterium]